jgi:hypothetical protein
MARKLAAVRKRKPSLRQISVALAGAGHFNELGKPFAPKSVAAMLTISERGKLFAPQSNMG